LLIIKHVEFKPQLKADYLIIVKHSIS